MFNECPTNRREDAQCMENVLGGYCKEDNFESMVLQKMFPGKKWVRDRVVPNSSSRTRPDFRCEELKLIVEYNGYRHYTQADRILRDIEKKKNYEDLGYMVVEWPYWLQPDPNTILALFMQTDKKFAKHYTDFHQGFVAKGCALPADFCTLGVKRFYYELGQLPRDTIIQVLWSLENKAVLYGQERVYPIQLPEDGNPMVWRKKIGEISAKQFEKIGSQIL